MQNFFAYIRVSTARQGEKGVSLQEQRDAIIYYAQRFGLEIAEWFEERETAAKRGRPIFTKMLRLLQKGKVGGVIIHKIDRGARNLRDWAELGELIDRGISVHFANENLDLYSRGGRLSADIQAVVAADYIRNLREEVKKGFYGRLKQGFYPLPAPLGYLDKGKAQAKEPDPERATLIKKVFEIYGSGHLSLTELVEEAYKIGLRTRRGGKVLKTTLAYILSNPFYMGLIRLKSGELFEGIHHPIISKSLFDRAQRVLQGKATNQLHKHDYLFRRSLACQQCKYSLIGERQKGNVYYRCHVKNCPQTCIREDTIENLFQKNLQILKLSEKEEHYFTKALTDNRSGWLEEKEALKSGFQLGLGRTKERLNRLADAFLDGSIDREMFSQKKSALLMEQKDLEEKILDLENGKTDFWKELEKKLELAKTSYFQYHLADSEKKRQILKSLTSNCSINKKNVNFTWRFPFSVLIEQTKFSNGAPLRNTPRTFAKIAGKIKEFILDSDS